MEREVQLLSASAAARRARIGRAKFAQIVALGQGPRSVQFYEGGRVLYATSAVDEWLHERDDRGRALPERRAS